MPAREYFNHHFMKRIQVFSLLVIMFMISGCPLLTKNSIDSGSYDVPAWLPGTWWEVDDNGKKKDGHLLQKADKKGTLKCYNTDSLGKPDYTSPRQVVLSSVAGKIFMGVYEKGDDVSDEGYYIFEFRKVSNTEFVLHGLKEHSIDYDASQKDIIRFLEQNKDSKDIYEPGEVTHYKKL